MPCSWGTVMWDLVDEQQEVLGEIIQQGRRRLARRPAGEVPGVVLDAVAVAHLLDHLQVEAGALLQALGLQEFARAPGTRRSRSFSSASMAAMAWRRVTSVVT